jgi:PEP-CTERM motif
MRFRCQLGPMRFASCIAACLISAVIITPASTGRAVAATIPLSISSSSGDPALDFYTLNANFTLPAGFSNASLSLSTFSVDDRGVLVLNGTIVASTGIFGPGSGSMVLTNGGPNDPFTFQYGNSGPFAAITGPFVAGLNILLLIVNDTSTGISGNLNPNSAPTSAFLEGTVTFDVVSQVPLPAALPLFATGLGALGLLAWRRKRKAA